VVVFTTGAVAFSPRYLLALGGIVIGNTMTVCTLMGRTPGRCTSPQRDEMEAWLSIGNAAPVHFAGSAFRQRQQLIPSTDQTRTTGVTLPGAFVGAVFTRHPRRRSFQNRRARRRPGGRSAHGASFTGVFSAPEVPLDRTRPLKGRRAVSQAHTF
jgi:hypothetical protein